MVESIFRKIRITEFPEWTTIKRIASSKIVKSSQLWFIIVPICFKLSVEMNYIPLLSEFSVPLSWESFYFGSIILALGVFVYQIRCPMIIRDFDDYSEYKSTGRKVSQIQPYVYQLYYGYPKVSIDLLLKILPSNSNIDKIKKIPIKYQSLAFFEDKYFDDSLILKRSDLDISNYNKIVREFIDFENRLDVDEGKVFWGVYRIGNVSNVISRVMSFSLIIIGLFFWLAVFVENAFFVFSESRLLHFL